MIGTLQDINDAGILGMNRRNAAYILPSNQRKFYPLVDSKLLTKQLLEKYEIPTPTLYFEVTSGFDMMRLHQLTHTSQFVIKPSRGAEGRGITVIVDRRENQWKTAGGKWLSMEDIRYHVTNILAGLYSLGGTDDHAFVEYCVISHPVFKKIAFQGVPDIRVILYRGTPVMAMLRLPTKQSSGKANLHQGAVGAGVNMLEGITLGGVHKNRLIDIHPDTQVPIAGFKIPFWQDILHISARTYDIFKLGYMGVDFVIDALLGPLILELNARPGLSIQLANREGLIPRLRALDAVGPGLEKKSPEERLKISNQMLHHVTLL